jgi:hypothetical protein
MSTKTIVHLEVASRQRRHNERSKHQPLVDHYDLNNDLQRRKQIAKSDSKYQNSLSQKLAGQQSNLSVSRSLDNIAVDQPIKTTHTIGIPSPVISGGDSTSTAASRRIPHQRSAGSKASGPASMSYIALVHSIADMDINSATRSNSVDDKSGVLVPTSDYVSFARSKSLPSKPVTAAQQTDRTDISDSFPPTPAQKPDNEVASNFTSEYILSNLPKIPLTDCSPFEAVPLSETVSCDKSTISSVFLKPFSQAGRSAALLYGDSKDVDDKASRSYKDIRDEVGELFVSIAAWKLH